MRNIICLILVIMFSLVSSIVNARNKLTVQQLQDTTIVALTLYAESANQSNYGRKLVSTVIWNRAIQQESTFRKVCLDPYQFSAWNGSTKKIAMIDLLTDQRKDPVIWKDCVNLAINMITGKFEPLGEYTHYYNPSLSRPRWAKQMKGKKLVDNHMFGYFNN